jgi:hypothetical protein
VKKLLLATALCALAMPAYADTTAYHVGATSDGGPGNDPNAIPSNTTFYIADNPNKAEAGPLDIFFAVPEGEVAPTITSILYGGVTVKTFTGPVELTALGDFTGSPTKDFYTFVGCTACNNSMNFVNFSAGITADTTLSSVPTAYDAYEAVVNVNFSGKDFIKVIGSFAEGTYIAPLSGTGVDTSFTNAGLITGGAVINPVIGVPEPSTWAMLIAGFGLLGLVGWKKRGARLAI